MVICPYGSLFHGFSREVVRYHHKMCLYGLIPNPYQWQASLLLLSEAFVKVTQFSITYSFCVLRVVWYSPQNSQCETYSWDESC